MIKIIRDDKTAKKYIEETKKLFDLYKYSKEFDLEESQVSGKFSKIISKIKENTIEMNDELKQDIINFNLLNHSTLNEIAKKYNYSISYIYALKQKILKEFAMVLFEVIIL